MAKLSPRPDTRDMLAARVVSIPNGKPAYPDGTLPSDHMIEFDYPGCTRVLTVPTDSREYKWEVHSKE